MPKWFTRCVKRFWRIDTKHFCCSKLRYTKTVYCVVFISSWTCRQLFNPHRIALGYFMFSNSCCFMFHLSQRSICGVVVARVVVAASASALAISQTTTSKTGFGLYMRHGVLRGGNKKGDFFFPRRSSAPRRCCWAELLHGGEGAELVQVTLVKLDILSSALKCTQQEILML